MNYELQFKEPVRIAQVENPAVARRRRLLQYAETFCYMIAVLVCMMALNWFMGAVVTGATRSWSAVNTRRLARAFRSWRWRAFYFLPAILLIGNLLHRRFVRRAIPSLTSLTSRVALITWVLYQFYQLSLLMYRLQRRQSDQIWSRNAVFYLFLAAATFACILAIESAHILAIFARVVADVRRVRSEALPTKIGKLL
ncbi:hypothetical protein BVRB_022560 [Beta vulgaris subsp. vulgaris]|uniref:Uncharacterized protein n=1 Tax=Beta vulgaris subsp. vulgaris TaxID=3555 RepID=A0A0J8B390_BETVV|nr:hypothetical protein BVRB_022560 [Beta vulgaris subsp. vulgaris]